MTSMVEVNFQMYFIMVAKTVQFTICKSYVFISVLHQNSSSCILKNLVTESSPLGKQYTKSFLVSYDETRRLTNFRKNIFAKALRRL